MSNKLENYTSATGKRVLQEMLEYSHVPGIGAIELHSATGLTKEDQSLVEAFVHAVNKTGSSQQIANIRSVEIKNGMPVISFKK